MVLLRRRVVNQEHDALIDGRKTREISGISKSERWRLIRAGRFPAPIRMGPRCTRYSLLEVLEWVEARKASRNPKAS